MCNGRRGLSFGGTGGGISLTGGRTVVDKTGAESRLDTALLERAERRLGPGVAELKAELGVGSFIEPRAIGGGGGVEEPLERLERRREYGWKVGFVDWRSARSSRLIRGCKHLVKGSEQIGRTYDARLSLGLVDNSAPVMKSMLDCLYNGFRVREFWGVRGVSDP